MIIRASYSDQVYALLKEKIINNEFSPGSKIKLEEVEKKFGVSKTPLKEAINKLEYEGFVTVKPRSGTYVSRPSRNEILQIYDLRQAIEWKAIQLSAHHIPKKELLSLREEINFAAKKINEGDYSFFFKTDIKIHKMIVDYSENGYIQKVKDMIDGHIHWFRVLGATDVSRPTKSNNRHLEIIEALFERDIEKCAELISIHIEEVKTAVVEDLTISE